MYEHSDAVLTPLNAFSTRHEIQTQDVGFRMRKKLDGLEGTGRCLEKTLNCHFRCKEWQVPWEYSGGDAPQMAADKECGDLKRVKVNDRGRGDFSWKFAYRESK